MRQSELLLLLFAVLSPTSALKPTSRPPLPSSVTRLRGGVLPPEAASSLASPSRSIPFLSGVAATVILPLTMYRQAYAFSVGYGFSVAAMGAVLLAAFNDVDRSSLAAWHATALVVYGVRLGTHLLVREMLSPERAAALKAMDTSPRLKRIPFALSVSLLYAMMSSPAIFSLQHADEIEASGLAVIGVCLQWFGCVLEAIADTQKLLVKQAAPEGDATWQGPKGGVYAVSRHPNYLGEILFWLGTFLGGAPAFGTQPLPWLTGGLGLASILMIMLGATRRLEAKQEKKYGGQQLYQDWRRTTSSLAGPF